MQRRDRQADLRATPMDLLRPTADYGPSPDAREEQPDLREYVTERENRVCACGV